MKYIYTINIISKARDGALYDEVALNKYPIVYISDCEPDEMFEHKDLVECIKRRILTQNVYDNSKICVRYIDEDYNVGDLLYILKDKINIDKYNGGDDIGRVGAAHDVD